MKKLVRYKGISMLFVGALFSSALFAQSSVVTTKTAYPQIQDLEAVPSKSFRPVSKSKTQALIWSEDFSAGIPATWTNSGTAANVLWEYRGPSTTPNISVGSRGQYAAANDPIQSPSRTNGFIIFDSNYLDDGGIAGNDGNGPAPAPHIGTLTTGAIDCSGHPFIELSFSSYLRQYQSKLQVAISGDGGVTFPDTAKFHENVAQNASSANGDLVSADISATAGNSTNVVLRFIFDGSEVNNLGLSGYYYWMVDDIELNDLPTDELRFVGLPDNPATTANESAPAQDIIIDNDGANAKTGIMNINQVLPVSFDANVMNYGSATQTNVQLHVDIYNNNTVVAPLTSPILNSLAYQDTGDFNDFFTQTSYTPTTVGTYYAVFSVTSDNITSPTLDTAYTFYVTDSITSLDFNTFSNSLGTDQIGDDGSALVSRLFFPNPSPTDGTTNLYGVDLRFSNLTVAGGDLQIEVYDTAGWTNTAFGGSPIVSKSFNVSSGMVGQLVRFDMRVDTNINGSTYQKPVRLTPGRAYFFAVYMFSNSGTNRIRFANDATAIQPGLSSLMYNSDDAVFYGGFTNSTALESPWIRAITGTFQKDISVEEYEALGFSVYPNPSNGRDMQISIAEKGSYTLQLVNTIGQAVSSQEITVEGNEVHALDFGNVAPGSYILNIIGAKDLKTTKVTIQ